MHGGGNGGGRYRILCEINMVPFIDVTLVLLIIFMVMTPFLVKHQIAVNPPTVSKAEPSPEDKGTITVQVRKDGAIFFEGRALAPEQLEATLDAALQDPAAQAVMVEADKETRAQDMVSVMSAAKKIGAQRIGIRVLQEKPGAPGARPRST